MLKRFGLGLGVLLCAGGWAQDDAASGETAPPSEQAEAGAASSDADAEPGPALEGDVITLKSGKRLAGVQVLRETPMGVQVEFLPGVAPLEIPRKQVASIDYDDIDPLKQRRRKPSKAELREQGVCCHTQRVQQNGRG